MAVYVASPQPQVLVCKSKEDGRNTRENSALRAPGFTRERRGVIEINCLMGKLASGKREKTTEGGNKEGRKKGRVSQAGALQIGIFLLAMIKVRKGCDKENGGVLLKKS